MMPETRSLAAFRQAKYRARKAAQSVTPYPFSQFTKLAQPGEAASSVSPGSAPNAKSGTPVATRKITRAVGLSCDASPSPKARHTGAGGRAKAVSHTLTRHQCQRLLWASSRASLAGFPFNRHTTFHHAAMGIPAEAGHVAVAALIKLGSDFLATKGHRLRWIFAREDGPGKGPHAHILWHVPPELARAFFGRWPSWKARLARSYAVAGHGRGGRVIKTRCIGGSGMAFRSNPQAFAFHLDMALGYALKGADPVTIAALALAKGHQPGGAVIGRRAGWWREHVRRNSNDAKAQRAKD